MKSKVASFLIRTGYIWGSISFMAAIVLYTVSFRSLQGGLSDTGTVSSGNSGLLAGGFNLIEIVALVWMLISTISGGDDVRDKSIDLFIKITLFIVSLGDASAIFYDSGYTTNLPGNPFGNVLTVVLRLVGAGIGAVGSEFFLIVGGLIFWDWWKYFSGTSEATPATPGHDTTHTPPAAPAVKKVTGYTLGPKGAKPPSDGVLYFVEIHGWSTKADAEKANGAGSVTVVEGPPPAPAAPKPDPTPKSDH